MENPIRKTDLDALSADVERLKKDFARAMEHLKDGAANAGSNLADSVTDEASELYGLMAKKGERAARTLGKQIEDQPITSLLVAFTAGFFISRLADRH